MRKAPFFKIYNESANNADLSELVESFTYEDCIEEDSYLRITIASDYSLALADNPELRIGTTLSFQFGFLGGSVSELHRAKITNIKHKYRERITMEISALDIGNVARKIERKKVWKEVTTQDIAQQIANDYGLELISENPDTFWDNIPQGNKSDIKFLEYLAEREEGGNWITYIRNKQLYFVKRGLETHSVRTYVYGDGNSGIISFEPEQKENTKQSASAHTTAVNAVNPLTGEATNADKNASNDSQTSLSTYVVDARNTSYKKQVKQETEVNNDTSGVPPMGNSFQEPVRNENEAKNLAQSKKSSGNLSTLEAKLDIEGSPLLSPNTIITMKGVAKAHSGNWFVKKVVHNISSSGYITSVDLSKNGTNIGTAKSKKPEAQNTTEGADKQENTYKVRDVATTSRGGVAKHAREVKA